MPATLEAGATTRDSDEARDAVQAAVKAWRSLPRVRDPESARGWLLSIVANQCRSTVHRRWWRLRSDSAPEAVQRSPENAAIRNTDLARAMSRLPADDRAILHLRFFQDLPFDEVGRVLGISTGAARSRVYRAAHRPRPELTEEDIR